MAASRSGMAAKTTIRSGATCAAASSIMATVVSAPRYVTRHANSCRATPGESAVGQQRGPRGEQLIEIVRERPSITVRDAGKELGVDPTGLYRVVHRLEQRGDLRKSGRGHEPASAPASE